MNFTNGDIALFVFDGLCFLGVCACFVIYQVRLAGRCCEVARDGELSTVAGESATLSTRSKTSTDSCGEGPTTDLSQRDGL